MPTPTELKPLEDQIILMGLAVRSLEMITGDPISDKDLDMEHLKKLVKKKTKIDNTLFANEKSDRLDRIQEKAFALMKEVSKFKADLEVDFTDKVKSLQDPGGRFKKNASIKGVIRRHLLDQ